MRITNQKGAVDLIFVAVLVILVAAAGFTAWRIQQADETVSDTVSNTQNVSTGQPVNDNIRNDPNSANEEASSSGDNDTADDSIDNDQLFASVLADLGISEDEVVRFTIFSSDKVTFSKGPALAFAYNDETGWKIAYEGQAVAACKELAIVPEQYRPGCTDQDGNDKYLIEQDGGGFKNQNYDSDEAIQYLGS